MPPGEPPLGAQRLLGSNLATVAPDPEHLCAAACSALTATRPSPPLCSYALWLDADLSAGISRNSTTFGNDSLAGQEEFRVGAVELWGLS